MLIALHKPFGVLCQFSEGSRGPGSGTGSATTLAHYVQTPDVYPAGRLDKNSEGLLLLTDNGQLQHRISHPKTKTPKEYWVQLEGQPTQEFAKTLCDGADLADGFAAAHQARLLDQPNDLQKIRAFGPHPGKLPEHRAENSRWFSVTMVSGKNRIVRRLCAALGYPVLRLVRVRIGEIRLGDLAAGESRTEQWSPTRGT